jgi:hypothetical protein
MAVADDPVATIFNQDKTGLGDPWSAFCQDDDVGLAVDVKASTTSSPLLSCTADRYRGLPFTSSSNEAQFGWKNGASIGSTDDGYLMALAWHGKSSAVPAPEYTKPWTIGEIMSAFSIPQPSSTIVKRILDAVGPFIDPDEITDSLREMQLAAASPQERNGIWFIPGRFPKVATRLTFHLVASKALLEVAKALQDEYGLFSRDTEDQIQNLVQNISFQMTRQVSGVPLSTRFITTVTFSLIIKVPIKGFIFWIEYNDSGVTCTLTEDPSPPTGDPFQSLDLESRLARLGAGDKLDTSKVLPDSSVFESIDLWGLTIGKPADGDA